MSQGTLQDHLQGRTHNAGALSQGQRLQIAVDAAQGQDSQFWVVKDNLILSTTPPTSKVRKAMCIASRCGRVQGNIEDIVDAKLQGQYDEKSVWKCVDIAMKCTSQGSHQRPTMAEVVMQLKERLELETPHDRTENSNMEVSDVSQSSAYVAKMLVAGIGPISKVMLGSLDFTLAALFYSDPKVFEMV
ncbi:hypothetical protein OPV22_031519 [Ensete ventricosum]|uniref:Uncharacterized protein n=1 Tax=Ensete ventricosum TaxID=4639 RepID=A0AAV8PPF3_ENSVE|nr:hypothetical protein OPV22_031519 [Ensete ventricosum]